MLNRLKASNPLFSLVDQLLRQWADTSGMAGSLEERVASRCRVEYTNLGFDARAHHLVGNGGTVTTGVLNADNSLIDVYYRNLIGRWNVRVHILEAFNGSYFFAIPGQPQEGGGALAGSDKSKPELVINYNQVQLNALESSYQVLRQAVYRSLCLQTRLKGYLDLIDLLSAWDSHSYDFTKVTKAFQDKIAADPIGSSGNDTITGAAGNDTLSGGAGDDCMIGGLGDDTYIIVIPLDNVAYCATISA